MSLTAKQEAFCRGIVSGLSGMDSYRQAYNTSGKDSTVNQEAVKLLAREDIQERIHTLQKPIVTAIQSDVLTEREKKKRIIWEGIEECRASGDHSGVARYMDILNKMDAEYININRNIEDKAAEIKTLDFATLERLAKAE